MSSCPLGINAALKGMHASAVGCAKHACVTWPAHGSTCPRAVAHGYPHLTIAQSCLLAYLSTHCRGYLAV